jgi:GNAT superfamily N-acetyltransferase
MTLIKKEKTHSSIRLSFTENEREIAHAFLYILKNDLHQEPFALLEDVFVEEPHRGKGNGSMIIEAAIEEARKKNCYKLICTSRHAKEEVHKLYQKHGFKNHGIEFRMDF